MAVINMRDKTLECKLVYYGPGRGGKTTNLEFIHKAGKKYTTSDMVSIKTKGDRTLYFDFLPIGIGKIKGYDVKVQLYTVPGQAKYNSTRKMVLKNVDGIVFVADSFKIRRKANMVAGSPGGFSWPWGLARVIQWAGHFARSAGFLVVVLPGLYDQQRRG